MRIGGIEYPDPWFANGTAEYQHYVFNYLAPFQQAAWGPYMKPLPQPAPNPMFQPEPPAAPSPSPVANVPAASCCLCQGGGTRNFIPGAGDVPQGTGDGIPIPIMNITTPASQATRQMIESTKDLPINTIVY